MMHELARAQGTQEHLQRKNWRFSTTASCKDEGTSSVLLNVPSLRLRQSVITLTEHGIDASMRSRPHRAIVSTVISLKCGIFLRT